MDQRHEEYVGYYRARAAKYAADPAYADTAAAEAELLKSIEEAPDLESWGVEMQRRNLNVACAVALARDHARAEAAFFDEIFEPVRAAGGKRLMAELTSAEGLTAADVAARVGGIYDENRKEVAIDELERVFEGDMYVLEELEILQTAEIPGEWRAFYDDAAADYVKDGRENWTKSVLPAHRMWDPNWRFKPEKIWETRFRRRIPITDEVLRRRLAQYPNYRGEG